MEIRDENGTILGETRSAVEAFKRRVNEGCEIYSFPIGIVTTGLLGLWAIWELEDEIDILRHPLPSIEDIKKMSPTETWSNNGPSHYEFVEGSDNKLIVITKSHKELSYPVHGGPEKTTNWEYVRGQVYSCRWGSPDRTGEYTLMN